MVNGGVLVNNTLPENTARRLPNRIVVNNALILDAIRYHRFGAIVQVTNGIHSRGSRNNQKRQVKRGKLLLEQAVGDAAVIEGGVAVIKNNQKRISDIDFFIEINNSDPQLLRRAAEECLESQSYLRPGDHNYLSRIVSRSYRFGVAEISRALSTTSGRYVNQDWENRLFRIKDKVLGQYVRTLFGDALQDHHVFALGAELRDQDQPRSVTTDLIIAANPSDFEIALTRISERYKKGNLSIRVDYSPTQSG